MYVSKRNGHASYCFFPIIKRPMRGALSFHFKIIVNLVISLEFNNIQSCQEQMHRDISSRQNNYHVSSHNNAAAVT